MIRFRPHLLLLPRWPINKSRHRANERSRKWPISEIRQRSNNCRGTCSTRIRAPILTTHVQCQLPNCCHPFFVRLPATCVGTLSTSPHTRSVIIIILHAMLSRYINLVKLHEKTGPLHLALVGLTAGKQAARQAGRRNTAEF